ncbi:MAG: NAD(+) synthase [Finegoldia sp.]|nr:NAD(+) synthase [Finegoldia sp.]
MDYKKLAYDIVAWIKDEVEKAGLDGLVFGISGGVDSSVLAALSKMAFPDNSLGLIMPIDSDPNDERDAILLADSINLSYSKVDLSDPFHILMDKFEDVKEDMAMYNVKARLRMIALYYYGQNNRYLVGSGSNRSEFMIGYFTKYGDSGADILPLVNLYKKDIYGLAKVLDIPEEIIGRKPSAGLFPGQSDEDELGFSYDELDTYLEDNFIENSDKKEIIDRKVKNSAHKREFARSFTFDREKYL